MNGLWGRIRHDHPAQRRCTTSANALDQAADDKPSQAHRTTAYTRADRAHYACDNPQRSVAENIAHHREEQLAGSADNEIHGVDPESAN